MPGDFEAQLRAASDAWVQEGLVTPEQAERIRARHPLAEGGATGEGGVATLLYGAAGVLLGAAGIALIAVSLDIESAQVPLALVAAAFFGAALAVRFLLHKEMLADALLVAVLPPAVACGFGDAEAFTIVGVVASVGLFLWRRASGFVPTLAVIAFSVAAPVASGRLTEATLGAGAQADTFMWLWVMAQLAFLIGVVLVDRLVTRKDEVAPTALAVIGLAASVIGFLASAMDLESEAVEVGLGVVMLGAAILGAMLRHRGLVLGGAVALSIDAIVFGFDVGGPYVGTLTLVVVAGVLIWQAEVVKRFLAPARSP